MEFEASLQYLLMAAQFSQVDIIPKGRMGQLDCCPYQRPSPNPPVGSYLVVVPLTAHYQEQNLFLYTVFV